MEYCGCEVPPLVRRRRVPFTRGADIRSERGLTLPRACPLQLTCAFPLFFSARLMSLTCSSPSTARWSYPGYIAICHPGQPIGNGENVAYPYESVSRPRTRTDLHQRKGSSIYAKVVALEGLNPRWCGRQERDLEERSGCDMSEKPDVLREIWYQVRGR